jgi:hypothetical protein
MMNDETTTEEMLRPETETPIAYADLIAEAIRIANEIRDRSGKRVVFSIGEEEERIDARVCEAPTSPFTDDLSYLRDLLHASASDLNYVLMDAMGHGERTLDRTLQEALLLFADAIAAQRG